ncbi:MAG: transketolase [Prevotellaceae bacterium]|jgi:transketolase|nr:transketolase [Prevotellaceae bacterium]
MDILNKQKQWAKEMRLKALDMALGTGSNGSHIGGAFSAMEIFATLYTTQNIHAENPFDENRDRIIVSKGHCVLAYYTALQKAGFLTESDLGMFDKNGTHFHGHPGRNIEKGIEFSSGSLGLGISFGIGVSLACKRKCLNNRIFIILGDGECNEGLVWEAVMSAVNFRLSNITLIVDWNKYQLDGLTDEVMKVSLDKNFESFGFDTQIVDGHDCDALTKSLKYESDKPKAILAKTIKGKGISFLTNNKISHHCQITQKQYEQALSELNQM